MPSTDSALPRAVALASRHGPWLAVVLLSAWLVWPVPTGAMPMSADHTVHLTRTWMWAQELAGGSLRGWSDIWFFGTPVGELYPVLGDAIVILIRVLSLGLLDWPSAYAVGFFVVFTVQGLALLRVGRAVGIGPMPGLVAAALLLVDVGAYREGGWLYTVLYGVWPQALSTALSWLAMAELAVACSSDDEAIARRRVGTAALALGGALLAHPMAMLSMAIGGPLLVVTLGVAGTKALRRTAVTSVVAAVLGLAVAAWWLVPMLSHRGWMASYGWMWRSLESMGEHALDGEIAQAMPSAVGWCILAGIAIVAVAGSRIARFLVAFGVVQWAMASTDALWELRLDQLSSGFSHIQYQRFIIAAKPGLFLAAGIGIGMLVHGGAQLWKGPRTPVRQGIAIACWLAAIGAVGWMTQASRAPMAKYEVGTIQTARLPGEEAREAELAELTQWLDNERTSDDRPWKITFTASRNVHWFMDAPVFSGVPVYKQGFTPGDNFVHKPESGASRVLDRARVRYVVADRKRGGRGQPVAELGGLRVLERPRWNEQGIAWLDGPGTLSIVTDDAEGGVVAGHIEGADETTRLVFAIGGFPRWTLVHEGSVVEWFEVPITAREPIATQADRRGGVLRGGKADGDDGSEPTLIAANVGDGSFELSYQSTSARDVLALVMSAIAFGLAGALAWPHERLAFAGRWLDQARRKLAFVGHPAVLGALVIAGLLFAVVRWREGSASEGQRAVGWLADGRAQVQGKASTRPFKTDMLIQPAVRIPGLRRGPSTLVFPDVPLGDTLQGWVAIDDDASKLRREGTHRMTIELGHDGTFTTLKTWKVPHRGGTTPIALPIPDGFGDTGDVRVIVDSEGKRPPPLGFDLQLTPVSEDADG